jgi:hypothetical protein
MSDGQVGAVTVGDILVHLEREGEEGKAALVHAAEQLEQLNETVAEWLTLD